MHALSLGSALLVGLLLAGPPVTANQCNLAQFDQTKPAALTDTTSATSHTEFRWGADIDALSNRVRSTHYVENLHDKALSLYWPDADLILPIKRPLQTGQVHCIERLKANVNDFDLTFDSEIRTSNDGRKRVAAHKPATSLGSLWEQIDIAASFIDAAENLISGIVTILVKTEEPTKNANPTEPRLSPLVDDPDRPGDRASQRLGLRLWSASGGVQIAFSPAALGLDLDSVINRYRDRGLEITVLPNLSSFVGSDELLADALAKDIDMVYVMGHFPEPVPLLLPSTGIHSRPAILVVSPGGEVIAATHIHIRGTYEG